MRITEEDIQEIVQSITEEFHTGGGGKPGKGGLSSMMKDSAPFFEAYTDIHEVVVHVLQKTVELLNREYE